MTPNEEWGLAGKVAIVTGGGAKGDGIGNGRAASILLARAGANVLVVDRDLTLAERTVAMIAGEGGSAAAASYDVTESVQCAAMVEDAVSRWGRLDCLDNNVGIGSKGTVVDETEENWARVMHVNVDSMFLTCKHAIPAMIRTAGGGSIVNISSISALRPRGLTAYTVSKGAVIALTKAIAVDHGATGHPRQLRCPRTGLHADGLRPWHDGAGPRHPPAGVCAEARGHRLGHRQRRAVPAVRPGSLHHRTDAGGGRWRHSRRAQPGIIGTGGHIIGHTQAAAGFAEPAVR